MNDGETMYSTQTMTSISCFKCHAVFMVAVRAQERWQDTGDNFWCPYCSQQQHYCESRIQKLKNQLKREQNWRQSEIDHHAQTRAELRETESRRRAEKGAKTKLKKRIANGVCPCCTRTFQNLGQHMTNQHPEYTEPQS